MVNKRGLIKIIEASIAIVIIFIVILSIAQIKKRTDERNLSEIISPILEEIAKNNALREKILADNSSSNEAEDMAKSIVGARLNDPMMGYDVTICKPDEICGMEKYPGDVSGDIYAGSRIISSVLTSTEEPKKINLFLWIKQ